MSKQISQVELRSLIANKTTLPSDIVDAFVDQFFVEIKKGIVDNSFLKLDGLGLFRVIQSGESRRVLFLGSKQPVEESLNISNFKNDLDDLLPESKVDIIEGDVLSNVDEKEISPRFDFEENIIIEDVEEPSNGIVVDNQILYYPEKKNKSKSLKIFAVVAIIVAVVSLVTFLYSRSKKDVDSITYTVNFVELENTDPTNFNYIIIPESDVSLEYISNTYYGCIDYWPYIYNANQDFVNNHLVIQAGSIVKVPKVMIDIIDYQNGNALINARGLGDKIKREKNIN